MQSSDDKAIYLYQPSIVLEAGEIQLEEEGS